MNCAIAEEYQKQPLKSEAVEDEDAIKFNGKLPTTKLRDPHDAEICKDIIESEGKMYGKMRDPPGQKCSYILPGDPYKETYRLSSFKKFSTEVPVDVCALAKYGFTYTGYKDRVKCFSCGSTVQNWEIFDDPKDAKWHFDQCKFVLGTETKNIAIIQKPIKFTGKFTSTVQSLDSGYDTQSMTGTASGSKELAMTQNARPLASPSDAATSSSPSSGVSSATETGLTNSLKVMQIGNNNQATVQVDQVTVPHQTARVVQPRMTGPPKVEGLVLAAIQSSYHQELLTKTLNLFREEDRRKSFFGWACFYVTVTPDNLCKAGFFYLGNSDRVQCFSCSGVLRNWKEGDDVDQQHRTHFPHCKMVMKTEIRNIPLPESIRKARARKPLTLAEPADPSPQELEKLKRQFPCLYPVNPHMRKFEDRLQTFDHRWPKLKVNATPRHIAKAGFFFLGDRDRAKCWYCNGGLQNWEPNDEPFTEHAKWFPGCEYILQCKGVDFVKKIVSKTPNLNRPALRHPRFDHRTGKILTVRVHPDQQQPVLIDPRANMSAGSLLRNHSSPPGSANSPVVNGSKQSQSNSANTEMENQAEAMGFEKIKIKRVVERRLKNNGSPFNNVEELIGELLDEPTDSSDVSPTEAEMQVGGFQADQEIPCGAGETSSQSLKRNNESPEAQNQESTGETPFKKSKTGQLNTELEKLENSWRCKACFENKADSVVLPCGHLSLCSNCANEAKVCPLCKIKKQSLIRAYLV